MRAIVAGREGDRATLAEAPIGSPTEGEVLVRVTHSSVNFKDGGAVMGLPGIARRWPLVLGIDVVGVVIESSSELFEPGEHVVLNGAGAGESRDGGFAEMALVPAHSLVRIPERISLPQAAAIGTAGFTAALALLAIENHGTAPGDGDVLVTGAAGGVGSVAISLLAGRGYTVVASTGRADRQSDYLSTLGASRIVARTELSEPVEAALQEARWAAVVDGVGSHTLVNAIAQTNYGGIAVSYGRAQGTDLNGTVLPFILRAVTLTGANSVDAPLPLRNRAWALLADELDLSKLEAMTSSVGLAQVPEIAEKIRRGQVRGRTVVDLTL